MTQPDPKAALQADIARLAYQEQRLRLNAFDEGTAWVLGSALRQTAIERGVAVAIEIRLARETVFFCAMPGTAPTNADWARRKRNTVELLQRSSYAVGRSYALKGGSLEQEMGLASRDFAHHGGAFPVRLTGGACVGVVTVSGLPQRQDHEMVVEALARLCGVEPAEVALD